MVNRLRNTGGMRDIGQMNGKSMEARAAFSGLMVALLMTIAQPAAAARYASLIVDERTGSVLHAVNPDSRVFPASLTKMMTLYMIFESLVSKQITFGHKFRVSRRAARRPSSKLGLKRGQTITVRDAIGTLATKSANDVATVVAEGLGGTEERFAQMMTSRAHLLGMTRTVFRNASGLPDKRQVTTARDMVRLSLAMRRDFPQFQHYFSMKSFTYRGRKYKNHNRMLTRFKGTNGMKTGYVRASGFNIVVSVERSGERLIGAVFGGKTAGKRDSHMITLLKRVLATIAENKKHKPALPAIASQSKLVSLASIAPAARLETEEERDGWAIQVGAFERFAPAHLAATRAGRLAPGLNRARVEIKSTLSNRGHVYRARLAGLSEARAGRACETLKKRKMTCLVVRMENDTAQGDR
jgi:D-alanyl-D-alanine carboxypeptidase